MIIFADQAWDDYQWWQANDRKMLPRLNKLIDAAHASPGVGIGKPERLTGNWSGYWSRRITEEDRLVYRQDGENILIAQCRLHY